MKNCVEIQVRRGKQNRIVIEHDDDTPPNFSQIYKSLDDGGIRFRIEEYKGD